MQKKHLPKSNTPDLKKKKKLLALGIEINVLNMIKSIFENL